MIGFFMSFVNNFPLIKVYQSSYYRIKKVHSSIFNNRIYIDKRISNKQYNK